MIFKFSDIKYIRLMQESFMQLPKRWDGRDFCATLKAGLFERYIESVSEFVPELYVGRIKKICNGIVNTIDIYFKGHPEDAYREFNRVMKLLMEAPLMIYPKNDWTGVFHGDDPLKLYRIRNVQNDTLYTRADIFHTPYNLRSKVATCRYSIAGFPSLYLGTSLSLCAEEAKVSSLKDFSIAAKFKLVRDQFDYQIKVIELALKPQDFLRSTDGVVNQNRPMLYNSIGRRFEGIVLTDMKVRKNYLYWYPLIAACSYIRTNKADPFAAEYIIPQLLMQWIRKQFEGNEFYGIRYFSCASIKASEMGFNYVFPVSGESDAVKPNFCKVLTKTFVLTSPRFIHEYKNIEDCEIALLRDEDLQSIRD
jgi:hypothetical protein